MGKRNGYLERRKIRDEVMQDAIRQTYQQYMTDMLILTLNDEPGSGLCPSQDGCGHEGHRREQPGLHPV